MNHFSSSYFAACRLFLRTLCTAAAAVAITIAAHSQSSATFGHQAWTTENGLPQSSVHQVFQSHDGYIWIATEGGVARFNGSDFKVFNHENNAAFTSDDISCFAQNTSGSMWIGTSDGLIQYSAGKFRRYAVSDGLPSPQITSLETSGSGLLYILTPNGAVTFDEKRFSPLQQFYPASPTAIASTDDGRVLLASTDGITEYVNDSPRPLRLKLELPSESIQGIGTLHNRGLWLRTRNSLTLLENGDQHIFRTGDYLPATRIESFLADSLGNIWVGTNKGLFLLDKRDNRLHFQPILGSDAILSISKDREGNLWIGTETAGLHILRQQNFRTIPAFTDHVITAIVQASDSAIWVGTNGDGLDRWQSGQIKHLSTHDGLVSEIILALAPDADGSMWVGTPDGLNHIEKNKVSTLTSADGLPDDFIRSLLADQDGSLWIGTRRGLGHLQGKNVTTLTDANGLQSNLIGALLKSPSPDNLWIGTLDGLSLLHNGKITTYNKKDGLSGDVITSLFEDSHKTLWIGTKTDGLSYWTGSAFVSLQRSDLPQTVDSILEDDRDYLWLGSTRGIKRISRSELISCASSPDCNLHPNAYGYADGMPTEEVSSIGHPAAWKTTDGLLWFATRKGVAIADPSHLSENLLPPPVVIERFTVDDSDLLISNAELSIPPGHSRFTFEYVGLSFVAPAKVRYRYILEGFDRQWVQAGSRRIAYYTNLPPHRYRFRVQAANNDGIWNDTGAEVAFVVHPPFYRTVWFLLLSIVLLAAIGILLYRARLRRLRLQFDAVLAERTRLAREIHDTLAQSFVGVSVQLELASQLLGHSQIPAAHQQIDRTRAYVREGLAEARRSIWNLRAATGQHSLPTRLTHLVEKSRAESLITDLTIGGTYRPLTSAVEDEVLRIAQEALTNVTHHAHATHVSVDLRYHSTRLTLSISDDGCGFEPSDDTLPARGHFGLQGMRERTAQINAQLTIESSTGNGTRITLDVPILTEKGTRSDG